MIDKMDQWDAASATAYGLFRAIQAYVEVRFGNDTWTERLIAVQGLGPVGYALSGYLHQAGASLYVSDADPERIARACQAFGSPPEIHPLLGHEIYRVECDVFVPCAMEGILNARTIPYLSCQIVVSAVRFPFDQPASEALLSARGILYVSSNIVARGGPLEI